MVFYSLEKEQVEIEFWYGNNQYFGKLGQPQKWINILGNISGKNMVEKVTYTLNDGPEKALSLGTDLHRLAFEGDFNIEMDWEEVLKGKNRLGILVKKINGGSLAKSITFYVKKGNNWPLPYSVNFAKVKNLQDAVQVVDGHWKLVPDGVRTVQKWYDRVLAMGDTSWKNYETITKITIHDFTPPEKGPPTYNVTHFGMAMRWRGHSKDNLQPSRKWYPLGAQGEFLIRTNPDSCQWRILFHGGKEAPPQVFAKGLLNSNLGKPIWLKCRVETLQNGNTQYSFKKWNEGENEPDKWDVTGIEKPDLDYPSGAQCLVPHNSDVTIHEVKISTF